MKKPWKIAVIGECMVELHREDGHLIQTYGGDTFNTAAYLSRVGGKDFEIDYMSAVGKGDSFSEGMLDFWKQNGVHSSLTQQIPGKLPGLYAIEVDQDGERSFLYWRNEAAVKSCFETGAGKKQLDTLSEYDMVYLSGISLAVLNPQSRENLLQALEKHAANGLKIAFDFNYRPHLWGNNPENSASHYQRIAKIARWIFLSPEEMIAAGLPVSDPYKKEFLDIIAPLKSKKIIIKNGDKPTVVIDSTSDNVLEVNLEERVHPVDTTAAGDSFTAGYLAGTYYNLSEEELVKRAQKLAAKVIMHPGAIIPEEFTPHIFEDVAK